MDYYLAIYSSVTLANRVKRNMPRDGEYVGVVHTPRSITKGGCSYALRFKQHKLSKVKQVSEEYGIKIKALYKESMSNGQKVYMEY
ncbi:putative Se/S carrier-like protein [Petroclostridium sp. X23]|uniref:putative Se/S carrier-like protein n=1 Tax=Petroclostridium sp. X23 TaxID=3045146 RepID=UPI0024AD5963|nr:putative Se/S carrier-like protein [Petroclostridium sp. X23]WHH58252.1 DUF3343 domain-containing protein [Petroclostridium sp. X23]